MASKHDSRQCVVCGVHLWHASQKLHCSFECRKKPRPACKHCGKPVRLAYHVYCGTECQHAHNRGPNHPGWIGRTVTAAGYVLLSIPEHPRAYRGRIAEHIVVMEKMLGRQLRPGETVHHINEIKGDNCPENLQLFASRGEHTRHHMLGQQHSRKYTPESKCLDAPCDEIVEVKGYCKKHYSEKYRLKNPYTPSITSDSKIMRNRPMPPDRLITDTQPFCFCRKPAIRNGLCQSHLDASPPGK